MNADSIIVMDNGKIVEVGNHFELIKNNEGHYLKLYQAQLKKNKYSLI